MDLERLKGILREHGVHDVEGSEAEVLSAVIEEVLGSTADIAACRGDEMRLTFTGYSGNWRSGV